MQSHTMPSGVKPERYLKLIESATAVKQHIEVLHRLQDGVQQYLPHDILLAGWGNLQKAAIQHGTLSRLPGVRSYAVSTDCLYVTVSAHEITVDTACSEIKVFMPCIDTALRQSTHPPQQQREALKSLRNLQKNAFGLSKNETQIMDWVATVKPAPKSAVF